MNPVVRWIEEAAFGTAGGASARSRSREPDRVLLTWSDGTQWTGARAWEELRRSAAGLRRAVGSGDRILVALPEARAAVSTLLGAWYCGAVPIQVGVPAGLKDREAFGGHVAELASRFGVRAVIVPERFLDLALRHVREAEVLAGEAIARGGPDAVAPDAGDGVAFIQLTSGTTGFPRGVVISQRSLAAHLDAIALALPACPGDCGVTWLPLYHDMGLIGGLLYPLRTGFPVTLLSPHDFRADPFRWLSAISRTRATHTVGPPSAYALLTRFAPRAVRRELDLSSLRVAMVGAEQVAPAVLRGFSEAFAPCGFRPEAFFPVYGLAEATVAVTFPGVLSESRFDRIDPRALTRDRVAVPSGASDFEVTSVGRPIPGCAVRVVDDAGADLPERMIGEVQVRTPSGMAGYYEDEAGTKAAFDGEWLRTGDLGYIADDDLFITGRAKELIISAGRNLSPRAIEDIANRVEGVWMSVAVSVRRGRLGSEGAVLVVETRMAGEGRAELKERIQDALEARGLGVQEIRLVSSGSLPRTSSGKVKRAEVAAAQSG